MEKQNENNLGKLKMALTILSVFTIVAIIYYTSWYFKFSFQPSDHQPLYTGGIIAKVWFPFQILKYTSFMVTIILLFKLIIKYEKVKYFEVNDTKIFDYVSLVMISLAIFGAAEIAINNYHQMMAPILNGKQHFSMIRIYINTLVRFIFNLFILERPQTMYLLIAVLVWVLKKFALQGLKIKAENESFI